METLYVQEHLSTGDRIVTFYGMSAEAISAMLDGQGVSFDFITKEVSDGADAALKAELVTEEMLTNPKKYAADKDRAVAAYQAFLLQSNDIEAKETP